MSGEVLQESAPLRRRTDGGFNIHTGKYLGLAQSGPALGERRISCVLTAWGCIDRGYFPITDFPGVQCQAAQ